MLLENAKRPGVPWNARPLVIRGCFGKFTDLENSRDDADSRTSPFGVAKDVAGSRP
jgi:hypothetical protein